MRVKENVEIYNKRCVKPFVEWYLGEFGPSTGKDMYKYAYKEGLFTRNYLPDFTSFTENIVNKCKGRTCGYKHKTGLWYLLEHPKTDEEAFMEKFAVKEII